MSRVEIFPNENVQKKLLITKLRLITNKSLVRFITSATRVCSKMLCENFL